jgi:small subunit ribosomal protein S17e
MGNIKTSFVKSVAHEIYKEHADEFTDDFAKNKEVIKQLVEIKSKRMMNKIVGYLTKLKKRNARDNAAVC